MLTLDFEDGMLAQNAALHGGRNRCRDDDTRKHGLVEVADDFFQSKSDGRDGRIERGGNSGSDPD
jgi:hypothetical protein